MPDSHLVSVPLLIAEFPRWLMHFAQHGPFTKPNQLGLHRKGIELRRSHDSVMAAIEDSAFLAALYGTLQAWGIGSRSSRLRPFPEFVKALRSARLRIAALERQCIDSHELDVDTTSDEIWRIIQTVRVVDNNAQLVAGTKTLHHVLPELIPPMDREYTQRFFDWQNPQFQYSQGECFKAAFTALAHVARRTKPKQYVGTHPWHTSTTKVLDNALVGFVRATDDGLVTATGTPAKPRAKDTVRTRPASAATRFDGVWNRIALNAGQQFVTVTGLPFTYSVKSGVLRPSRANRNLPRSDFEKAFSRVPLNDIAELRDLQGPSYIYAIMMDNRIRLVDW